MFKEHAELREVLTGRAIQVERAGIALGVLLERFPVAVLVA